MPVTSDPEMLEAIARCHDRLKTALITNNVATMTEGEDTMLTIVDGLFDVIVESSKTGLRKPDPRIYELACEQLGVAPSEVVFLDDLGINLKPAAQMGMTTIKVVDPDVALAELECRGVQRALTAFERALDRGCGWIGRKQAGVAGAAWSRVER